MAVIIVVGLVSSAILFYRCWKKCKSIRIRNTDVTQVDVTQDVTQVEEAQGGKFHLSKFLVDAWRSIFVYRAIIII